MALLDQASLACDREFANNTIQINIIRHEQPPNNTVVQQDDDEPIKKRHSGLNFNDEPMKKRHSGMTLNDEPIKNTYNGLNLNDEPIRNMHSGLNLNRILSPERDVPSPVRIQELPERSDDYDGDSSCQEDPLDLPITGCGRPDPR